MIGGNFNSPLHNTRQSQSEKAWSWPLLNRALDCLVVSVVGAFLLTAPASVQASDDVQVLKEELDHLKQGQEHIQKDLQEIKSLLKARTGQARSDTIDTMISLEGAALKGDRAAKVVLLEFSDYECPYCAQYSRETFGKVDEEYIRTGKVLYALRDFPLESIHARAVRAAEAARCAGEQGQYWEMHDRLFSNQAALSEMDLSSLGHALRLDMEEFEACLKAGRQAAFVRKDLADGQRIGVSGTPTFFIGLMDPTTSHMRATKILRGAVSFGSFKQTLEGVLSLQQAGSPGNSGVK
jgi:protein-disulfide isomerase